MEHVNHEKPEFCRLLGIIHYEKGDDEHLPAQTIMVADYIIPIWGEPRKTSGFMTLFPDFPGFFLEYNRIWSSKESSCSLSKDHLGQSSSPLNELLPLWRFP
jgi:hypothetical protein